MTYLMGDVPVGKYDLVDLANFGIGHGAIDGGAGYTYFDPKTANEFSATFGLTGNFRNQSTGYTNGIDAHLDLGASKFVTTQLQLGPGRLLLPAAHRRQRLRSDIVPVQVPRRRRRPANRLFVSRRQHAGLFEPEGLQGIRRRKPAGRLECVAHIRAVARGAVGGAFTAADFDQGRASQLKRRAASMAARLIAGCRDLLAA